MTEGLTRLVLMGKPLESVENGDFQEVVENGYLYVRQDAYDLIGPNEKNATDFYVVAKQMPGLFIEGLGWDYDEVEQAREKLKESLRGYVHDEILDRDMFSRRRGKGANQRLQNYKVPFKKGEN